MQERKDEFKQLDTTVAQQHYQYSENTMNEFVSRSAGMAILQLKERYFQGKSEEDIQKACHATLEELKTIENVSTDEELKASIHYVLELAAEPLYAYLDTVALYLPVAGSSPVEYKYSPHDFPFSQALALTWKAIHDDELFAHHLPELKISAEKAREERCQGMLLQFQRMRKAGVCHKGNRHNVISSLSGNAKGIDIISDEKMTVLKFLRENVDSLFWTTWRAAETAKECKKKLFTALCDWMVTANLKSLLSMLDPEGKLSLALNELFIKHGSCPDQTNAFFKTAVEGTQFSADAKHHPELSHLNSFFNANEMRSHPAYNQFIESVKVWINNHFDLDNAEHREWLKKFYTLHHAQCLLEKYSLLLKLTGERDHFVKLENSLHEYFMHFKIESLAEIPDAMLTMIKVLESKITERKLDTLKREVENFFAEWYWDKSQRNTERLEEHYQKLLHPFFRSQVVVDDDQIERIIKEGVERRRKNNEEERKGVVESKEAENKGADFRPYEFNRLFLHAFLTPRANWTTVFVTTLGRALTAVKNVNASDHENDIATKRSSYPDALLKQLDYLLKLNLGEEHEAKEEKAPAMPPQVVALEFVFADTARTLQDWITVFSYLNEAAKAATYQAYRLSIQQAIRNERSLSSRELGNLAWHIPAEYLVEFYKNVGFTRLKNDHSMFFADIVCRIPIDKCNEFFNLIIDECLHAEESVKPSHVKRLIEIDFSESLSPETIKRYEDFLIHLPFEVVMSHTKIASQVVKRMDAQQFSTFIQKSKNIYNAFWWLLQPFSADERSELLKKLPDQFFINILMCSDHDLSKILFYLYPEDCLSFLSKIIATAPMDVKYLTKTISALIHCPNPNLTWKKLLNDIGGERLRKIISTGEQLKEVLCQLQLTYWESFFATLGDEHLNKIPWNASDVNSMLDDLLPQYGLKLDSFLMLLKPHWSRLMHDDQFFAIFVKLPDDILNYFLKAIPQSDMSFLQEQKLEKYGDSLLKELRDLCETKESQEFEKDIKRKLAICVLIKFFPSSANLGEIIKFLDVTLNEVKSISALFLCCHYDIYKKALDPKIISAVSSCGMFSSKPKEEKESIQQPSDVHKRTFDPNEVLDRYYTIRTSAAESKERNLFLR